MQGGEPLGTEAGDTDHCPAAETMVMCGHPAHKAGAAAHRPSRSHCLQRGAWSSGQKHPGPSLGLISRERPGGKAERAPPKRLRWLWLTFHPLYLESGVERQGRTEQGGRRG